MDGNTYLIILSAAGRRILAGNCVKGHITDMVRVVCTPDEIGQRVGGPAGGEGVLHLVPSSEKLSKPGELQPQTAGSSSIKKKLEGRKLLSWRFIVGKEKKRARYL